ncbi:MAG: hypothetical protein ACLRQF_06285 [Thomasclavelia ramosa]
MRILSFKGGIHPHDNKSLSANHPIKLLNPGDELIYPLSQHIGAPAKAIVAKGDHVLVGQIIANGNSMILPMLLVLSLEPLKQLIYDLPYWFFVDCIVITNDHQYQSIPEYNTTNDYHNYSSMQIRGTYRSRRNC